MALETVTHIDDLTAANPTSGDSRTQGDDHLRNIKKAIRNDVNGFDGATLLYGSSTTGNDTYTFTTSGRTDTAYNTGQIVVLTVDAASGTTNTLNIDSAGAKSIVKPNGEAVEAGELKIGTHVLYYDGTNFIWFNSPETRPNLLINGGFDVWQRGITFTAATTPGNNDDTYLMDRWVLLTEGGNTVEIDQHATTPGTSRYAVQCSQAVANQQYGFVSILEGQDTAPLKNKTCTFSFQAYTLASSTITKLRCAIIEWAGAGAEDVVESDVISAWASGGTDPTLATNWAYVTTPADLTLSTSYQKFTTTGTVGGSAKNLAVLIWVDDGTITATANDILYIGECKLEVGSIATAYESPLIAEEVQKCQRYYYRIAGGSSNSGVIVGHGSNADRLDGFLFFPVDMRIAPTAIEQSGTASHYNVVTGATDQACTSVPLFTSTTSKRVGGVRFTSTAAFGTVGHAGVGYISNSSGYLGWDVEL